MFRLRLREEGEAQPTSYQGIIVNVEEKRHTRENMSV